MAKRKQVVVSEGQKFKTITVGGPKKYFNKIVKKVGWGKTRYSYVAVTAPWYKNIVNEIKTARRRKGLTQKHLATLLGTTQSEVSRLEGGQSNPTVAMLERLFGALDLDLKIFAKKPKK